MELLVFALICAKFNIVISNFCNWVSWTELCSNNGRKNCLRKIQDCRCNGEISPHWKCKIIKDCEPYDCLVSKDWCPWMFWSEWSTSCGVGERFRTRRCCSISSMRLELGDCEHEYEVKLDNKDIESRNIKCGFQVMFEDGKNHDMKLVIPIYDSNIPHSINIGLICITIFMILGLCWIFIVIKVRKKRLAVPSAINLRNVVTSETGRGNNLLSSTVASGSPSAPAINVMDSPPSYGKVMKEMSIDLPNCPPPSYESTQKLT